MQQNSAIATFLLDHGIKPSAQRIAVAGYLAKHLTHPTVDEIYCDLLHDYPTLSRTTVYNTVNLLAQNGCISTLDVDSLGTRYDFNSSLTPTLCVMNVVPSTTFPLAPFPAFRRASRPAPSLFTIGVYVRNATQRN